MEIGLQATQVQKAEKWKTIILPLLIHIQAKKIIHQRADFGCFLKIPFKNILITEQFVLKKNTKKMSAALFSNVIKKTWKPIKKR